MHSGASAGPRTAEGLARSRRANWKHGRYSAEVIAIRREATAASTTLADLLPPLLVANPFSAMRASLRRWSSDEFEDGVAHGWQGRLGRWPVDSFFPALQLQGGDAGGRRTRSSS